MKTYSVQLTSTASTYKHSRCELSTGAVVRDWSVHPYNKMDTGGDNGSYAVHEGDKLATSVLWFGCDMDLSVSQCIGATERCFSAGSHMMAQGTFTKRSHERAVKAHGFQEF